MEQAPNVEKSSGQERCALSIEYRSSRRLLAERSVSRYKEIAILKMQ